MRNIGIALRVPEDKKPEQLINIHYAKEVEAGSVALSTDLKIAQGRIRGLETIILFFKDGEQINYVEGNILAVKTNKQPFIPQEWKEYIPDQYMEEKNTWILMNRMTIISEDDLSNYVNESGESLIDVLKKPRFPRTFFNEKNNNILDNMPKLFK